MDDKNTTEIKLARRVLYELARGMSRCRWVDYSEEDFDLKCSTDFPYELEAIDEASYKAIKAMAFENPGWRR